ncbi:hypothetical protein GIB67_032791 [Kingdonia uniflora]|uniref:GrpE protein homolog n=1 Tax=Kingdonia uniflora TaxID=39325 RepID=A0A7J7MWG0_9MAGN|nr:hypothetical protein GIB67_032791 [Kingdonia uniflora]
MSLSRVFSQISRNGFNQCRFLISSRSTSISFHSLRESFNQVPSLHRSALNATRLRESFFSSAASSEHAEKETNQSGDGHEAVDENIKTSTDPETANTDGNDTDKNGDFSIDNLVKLITEKEELLNLKHKEMEKMQDKLLRSYAEMENVMDRTRREAENSKIFAIQNFAKTLLDVADNLGRASSVVKVSFSKIDSSKDTVGAVPLLKTLLEGVEMTEKQLSEAFRKFGVEKYDPINEQFDPHRHNAVYQIPDDSKPVGTVASVLKPGYMLHDRIIRPAEVGVTQALNNETKESS